MTTHYRVSLAISLVASALGATQPDAMPRPKGTTDSADTGHEGPLCGTAAILRWLSDQPHAGVLRIDIDHLAISGIGSFAWKLATFRTTLAGPAEAGAGVVTGSHGWLLQRDDAGAWRISVVAWTITGTAVG